MVMFGEGVANITPIQLVDGKIKQNSKVAVYCAYDEVDEDTYSLDEVAVSRSAALGGLRRARLATVLQAPRAARARDAATTTRVRHHIYH